MNREGTGMRRFGRLTFKEPMGGDITASHEVQFLDISLGGARLEHTIILRPGSSCYVRLPLPQDLVTIMGWVVWSTAVGRAEGSGGSGLLYHSGVEFGTMAAETQARLAAFLEAHGTPPASYISPA